ncbi:hypothetical protein D3C74_458740 [compost metagenome]
MHELHVLLLSELPAVAGVHAVQYYFSVADPREHFQHDLIISHPDNDHLSRHGLRLWVYYYSLALSVVGVHRTANDHQAIGVAT